MDAEHEDGRTERKQGKGWRAGIVAGGAALGMTVAGLGIAAAQSDEPTTTTTPLADATQAPQPGDELLPGRHGHGHRFGTGLGIHGEFTRRARDGGYQTLATQVGEVTAVSVTSITLKSEDGFARTYTVDDNTLVNAGNDGIADVKVGDEVFVTALVVEGKANAVHVHDRTRVRELRDRWAPGGRR